MAPKSSRRPIPNTGGFYWEYEGGHGYRGRHAYNPSTNEAISTADATALRNGTTTIEQVLSKQANPLAVRHIKNATGTWRVSMFVRMSGAWNYATDGTSNPSYFIIYGLLKEPYEDEPARGYRAITTLSRPGRIRRNTPLDWCWERVSELFDVDSRTRYIVWERV